MNRHLEPQPPRRSWFLSTRAEIDAWALERWATLSALEADTSTTEEPERRQLDLGRAA